MLSFKEYISEGKKDKKDAEDASKEYYIDLDIYSDDDPDKDARKLAKKFSVKCTCIDDDGPGGGSPVYRFKGEKANLVKLIKKYDDGNGDWDYLVSQMEPVK